ncbi:MAG: hypothetical protein GY839_21865 [candidate division Zixibacteria bacterium]|nr:hypothetical protein [candidate division Zixibacteria bacterium]
MFRNRAMGFWVFCILSLLIGIPAAPAFSQANGADTGGSSNILIAVDFSAADLEFDEISGYDMVRFEDCDYGHRPGEPMIASRVIKVAVPEGMKVTDLSAAVSASREIAGEYNILPMQPARRIGYTDDFDFIEPNPDIYNSSEIYPFQPVEFIRQSDLAGQAIAIIRINPLRYIPSQKKLTLIESLIITIEGVDGYICGDYLPANISENDRQDFFKMLTGMVVNPEAVRMVAANNAPLQSSVDPGDYDYVIITNSSYVSYFQSLADWKTKKGIPATIVTTNWIYNQGGYTGADTSKIRQFIIDARTNWGTIYFLLGGDTNIIPTHVRYINSEDVPNDSHYGDYDHDWICEVHVGRASVRTVSEINTFKNKVLTYEKNPPMTNYANKAAFFGFDLDESTEGEDCKDAIDIIYLPSSIDLTTVYDTDAGSHEAYVKSAINSGHNLVNHIDHCNEYFLGTGTINHSDIGLTTSEVDAFYNGNKQCVFYTIGCWANAFDMYESISEHFVHDTNGGAVAYVGNIRNGLYYAGDENSLSFRFDRYFFRSLFSQNHYKIGNCVSDHKNDVPTGDPWDYIFTGMALLGDPEMPIWTEDPSNLVVSHPAELPIMSSPFTVHVEESGSGNVYQATVCLMKDDEVYLTGSTNYSGDITFNPEPTTTGTMYVTVTKHNYIPSESEATVQNMLGAVGGIVRGVDMIPLENAFVFCTSPALDTSTDSYGEYVLYGFDTGSYTINFSYPGYLDTSATGVSIVEGDTASVHMILTQVPDDVGVTVILSPLDSIIMNIDCPIDCEIANFGSATNSFDVVFEARPLYSSTVEFTDTFAVSGLTGNSIDTINFADSFTPALDTVYSLTTYTLLGDDMNPANNDCIASVASAQGVAVWYGNLDLSPITAYANSQIEVDVYGQTSPDVFVADLHLCLGAEDQYIDSLLSHTEGQVHYPLTEWEMGEFFESESDPNPEGWSSQSFVGFARLARAGGGGLILDTPWLHVTSPTRLMTFVVESVDDSSITGQVVNCLGPGLNPFQGPSNAGDSLGWGGFKVVEFFSPVQFRSPFGDCDYMPGDINSDDLVIGSDLTYLVNYFRGVGNPPPDSCWNDLGGDWLYSAADVNGDCLVIGSDVTFLVNYFRGMQPVLQYCPETPPIE